jgi:anti-sigma-K factor RskA
MSLEEREELASLYVLGVLEGGELAAFERELVTHPELTALVAELEEASTLLATSVPQHPAPNALRHSVLEQIKGRGPIAESAPRSTASFSWASWIPWAIAAGLTVCCALLWNERSRLSAAIGGLEKDNQSLLIRIADLDAERVRLETRISALESEKNNLQVRVASLEARDPLREIQPVMLAAQAGAPRGAQIVALWDPKRREGALYLAHLPKPARDKDYQLWIITPESKQPLDAGVIPAASEWLPFSATQPVNQVAALAISVEPKGGSVTPRGPVIYLGRL